MLLVRVEQPGAAESFEFDVLREVEHGELDRIEFRRGGNIIGHIQGRRNSPVASGDSWATSYIMNENGQTVARVNMTFRGGDEQHLAVLPGQFEQCEAE